MGARCAWHSSWHWLCLGVRGQAGGGHRLSGATGIISKETGTSQHRPCNAEHRVFGAQSHSQSPPRFTGELKASPEQPARSQEGSLHAGYPGRASALRAPCNHIHLCPDASLSLQTPASLQAVEEPPHHLSAVSGTSAPGKNTCSWESGRPEGCREPGLCPSRLPCPAASTAPGAWAWGGAG